MTKVFIDVLECKTPHKIFTGKNALLHACFYVKTGRICENADHLYNFKPVFNVATSWHRGEGFISKEGIEGNGVHMKMYEYEDFLIFSSQNQVSSPLFEMAILYEKRPKLLQYFYRTFKRAKLFSDWWKQNNYYGLKGMKNI